MRDNSSPNFTSFGEGAWTVAWPRPKTLYALLLLLLVIGVGACLASPSAEGESAQSTATVSATGKVKSAPKISATPDRVTVGVKSGRCDIRWDTGDGSMGFVYVSMNGAKRDLFATGATGSATAPWIQAGSYVFELYSDAEQRKLLAKVTVSGIPESRASPSTGIWQRSWRWLLFALALVVTYLAVYYCAPTTIRTEFPAEPSTSPRQLHVARNLLLGLTLFACLDGAIFHTGLYTSILAPVSFAGRMVMLTKAEKQRVSSGRKEVLVVGDSRIAEGFSAAVADQLGSEGGLKFESLAEPASSIEIWHYILREVDPTARRYSAIVIPYGYGHDRRTQAAKISMAGPLLRYGDCFDFPFGFERWSDRYRAFTACIFRGSAFQADVVDLLENPIARVKSIQLARSAVRSRTTYEGHEGDIAGTRYDPVTGQLSFPSRLTEAQREAIRRSLTPPTEAERALLIKFQRYWLRKILERYSGSSTAIVLMPAPRGPFGGFSGFSMAYDTFFGGITTDNKSVFSLPEHMFDFIEAPQYYFDGYHLNAKGRQKFTEIMVAELVRRLQSDGSTNVASEPK